MGRPLPHPRRAKTRLTAAAATLSTNPRRCHPERSNSRYLRVAESKDLRLLWFCSSSRRDLLLLLRLFVLFHAVATTPKVKWNGTRSQVADVFAVVFLWGAQGQRPTRPPESQRLA